ncbi:hypothetical protein C8J57DRAFT_1261953 [Mycena rebaudengoi]|nr:hypothetical protein C8J57DRAFT_1261953 [Mycena rebaudengoi]
MIDPLTAIVSGVDFEVTHGARQQRERRAGRPSIDPHTPDVIAPKTRTQKLMPALHLLAMWAIAYFVVFCEPLAVAGGGWELWAKVVGRGMALASAREPQFAGRQVPFFWGFVTLELLFSGLDTLQLPTLLTLALPHLLPPIPPSS